MVLASLSPPSLELVHSLGDPLLSRSSVCSSFRPVSEISAHCSHLRGSSHLDSTRTLVPRTALPARTLVPQLTYPKSCLCMTQNEKKPCDETRTFPMLRFPPVRSRVGLGEHPSDCLRGSKRAHKAHNKNKTNRYFIRDHLSCRS